MSVNWVIVGLSNIYQADFQHFLNQVNSFSIGLEALTGVYSYNWQIQSRIHVLTIAVTFAWLIEASYHVKMNFTGTGGCAMFGDTAIGWHLLS